MITESKAARKSAYAQSAASFSDLSKDAGPGQAPDGRPSFLKYKLRWGLALFCLACWVILAAIFIW
ncbi:hypothetical protein [Rhizobium sp. BE258]|jgi:hypothetical protein|uniref:hypothetical protein n=1 Tax=Rhizobium sp. BE258 TaxID=2817722 RepID=UPI000DDC0DB3|nr:hypothetical protein [Rhizobium sp. BE258]MDR7144127.1 hypothetical protein [Rhizobium sp. BE258]